MRPRRGRTKDRCGRRRRELEVVGDDEEAARRDEEEQPGRPGQGGGDADRNGAADRHSGKRDQDAGRDPGAQRTPVQLVERMRPDSEREEKRGQRGQQPPACELGGQRRADRNVRGARRCRGSEAASRSPPAAGLERVERGTGYERRPRARGHRRARAAWVDVLDAGVAPQAEGRDARETRGCSARGTIHPPPGRRDDRPERRRVRADVELPRRPGQARGRPNSSIAIVPPRDAGELCIVAPGSGT